MSRILLGEEEPVAKDILSVFIRFHLTQNHSEEPVLTNFILLTIPKLISEASFVELALYSLYILKNNKYKSIVFSSFISLIPQESDQIKAMLAQLNFEDLCIVVKTLAYFFSFMESSMSKKIFKEIFVTELIDMVNEILNFQV